VVLLYLRESLPGGPGDGFTGGVPELFGVKNLRSFVRLSYYLRTGSVLPCVLYRLSGEVLEN
jgi:hypothetical protein